MSGQATPSLPVPSTVLVRASPDFRADLLRGLRRQPKKIPCKYFYDKAGSDLFEQICELEEYYPTRTERKILEDNIEEIAATCGAGCLVLELGSGSSIKTRLLLDHLESPAAYVPVDISRPALEAAAEQLQKDYCALEIIPLWADYHRPLKVPVPARPPARCLIFFPGSTIGNFTPRQAVDFLRRIGKSCEEGDALLIGVDLTKDRARLERAYDDSRGVTAAFNRNVLRRANRELGANFDLSQFSHRAFYNEGQQRIEMHLVSELEQSVRIGEHSIAFERDEPIVTEYSYKYSVADFYKLAAASGWMVERTWQDEEYLFSVHYARRT